jgi:hypothetical protein
MMNIGFRLGLSGLALVATLGLWSAVHPASAHTTATAPARLSRCFVGQLDILPDGSSAGLGHVGFMFRVFNHSVSACTLSGYPGAQLLDGGRRPLPTHVSRGLGYLVPKRTPHLVKLVPGASGYFVMEWDHNPSPGQSCPVAPFIRITPPNAYSSVLVPIATFGIDACGGNLVASPVAANRFPF